jgi:hypothetical protein
VTVLLVLVLATASSAAFAATRGFKGPIDRSGSVAFEAKARAGKVVKVRPGFAFNHLPIACDQGRRTISGSFNFRMKVHRGRFGGGGAYTSGAGTGKVIASGRFKHRGRRAVGTITAHGNFAPGGQPVTGCHSGSLSWHVHAR